MHPAIRVQNISKKYRLGETHSGSVRELVNSAAARLFGRRKPPATKPRVPSAEASRVDEDGNFWALKDVSFDVQPGEVVGIIGRNGAGKSTLLKILSNIVAPTSGRIELHGRVASLLEVGTGFHPELTGRENVFLNGAILGMPKNEIRRKFDQIVDFSGVETFIDTPVKRYSSGMYVRLAFAVAAHLDSEILIIDEILAVGDADFQAKCIGAMGELGKVGKTVVFVSHSLPHITSLTNRAHLLSDSRLVQSGLTSDVVQVYLKGDRGVNPNSVWKATESSAVKTAQLLEISLLDHDGEAVPVIHANRSAELRIRYRVHLSSMLQVAFRLNTLKDHTTIFTSSSCDCDQLNVVSHKAGEFIAAVVLPQCFLVPGSYYVLVAINGIDGSTVDLVEHAVTFTVSSVGSLVNLDRRLGIVAPLLPWSVRMDV